MSYLLDKKIKRNKFFKITFFIVIILFLFYFRSGIFNGLSYGAHYVLRPVLIAGESTGERFKNISSFFHFKQSLLQENESLKSKLSENEAKMSNYNSLLDENTQMKEILGRKPARPDGRSGGKEKDPMILAFILSKPNRSLYDTLIIDAGIAEGIMAGNMVFALGDVPIGRVAEVYENSSKVILFSNPGEKTEAIVSGRNVFVEVVGRGGGNFEMNILKDLVVEMGNEVVLPGITPYVVAVVKTIISDPRDPFQKALLVSPVNIQELKFVEVEK